MASETALAKRKGNAVARLATLRTELAELTGVPPMSPPPQQRDPEFMRIQETEAMADFLESLKPAIADLGELRVMVATEANDGEKPLATLQRILSERAEDKAQRVTLESQIEAAQQEHEKTVVALNKQLAEFQQAPDSGKATKSTATKRN